MLMSPPGAIRKSLKVEGTHTNVDKPLLNIRLLNTRRRWSLITISTIQQEQKIDNPMVPLSQRQKKSPL